MLPRQSIWIALLVVVAAFVVISSAPPSAISQESGGDKSAAHEKQPSKKTDKAGRQKELEVEFQKMLSGSVLKGMFQMVKGDEGLAGKAPLADARPEEYTIGKVSKASGDYWIITAKIKYEEREANIPITVRVVWAEDTPIITLDKVAIPGLGTYSARVMVYRNFYAGTWFGDCYGGILSGQITRPEAPAFPSTRPAGVMK